MPPALTPALAVDYVRELSADVRAVVVLGADGRHAAGPPHLAAPARELLAADDAAELEAVLPGGVVCAVRAGGHAAVAVCGRFALPGVVRADLREALAALAGAPGTPGADAATPDAGAAAAEGVRTAAERLISAQERGSEA
jgi:hypothetical protein